MKKKDDRLEDGLKFWGTLLLLLALCYFGAGLCHWIGGS